MITRIKVVGNSHVASLMRGWECLAPDFPGVELSFFASGSSLFDTLTLDSKLRFGIHDTRGFKKYHIDKLIRRFGATTVDLSGFDAVMLVGHGCGRKPFLNAFGNYSIDNLRERAGKPRMSEPAFMALAAALTGKYRPGPEWRNWSRPRLFLLPAPVPRESCPADDPRYTPWARFAAETITAGLPNVEFLNLHDRLLGQRLREVGIGYVGRPPEVVAQSGLTPDHFGFNRSRLGGDLSGEADDFHHMNAEFGALMLRRALDICLAELPARDRPAALATA